MIVAIADTHAAFWYLSRDKRLSSTAKQFFDTAVENNQQVGVSSISLVEIVYLSEKGRIGSQSPQVINGALRSPASILIEMPVNIDIVETMQRVSWAEIPDMPDRIIAATALHLNVPIISRDSRIQASNLTTIW